MSFSTARAQSHLENIRDTSISGEIWIMCSNSLWQSCYYLAKQRCLCNTWRNNSKHTLWRYTSMDSVSSLFWGVWHPQLFLSLSEFTLTFLLISGPMKERLLARDLQKRKAKNVQQQYVHVIFITIFFSFSLTVPLVFPIWTTGYPLQRLSSVLYFRCN